MMKRLLSLILSLFFIVALVFIGKAYADDAAYYGDGINIYPLQNTDIQLVSETITITDNYSLNRDKRKSVYRWLVEVEMTFKNTGPDTTVQMGFPVFTRDSPDGEDQFLDTHFKTWVDGQEIVVKKKRGIPNPKLKLTESLPKTVYAYALSFKSDETKKVFHSYSVGGFSSSIGDWRFTYILRTGALWKGNIENIKIYYKTSSSAANDIHCTTPQEKDSKLTGNDLTLFWEFKNYKPSSDLVISGGREPSFGLDDYLKMHKSNFANTSACGVRNIRNQFYAYYGCPFKSPFIHAKFYYPDPGWPLENPPPVAGSKSPTPGSAERVLI